MDHSNPSENILSSGAEQWMRAARTWAGMYQQAWQQVMQNTHFRIENPWSSTLQGASPKQEDCCRPNSICPPEPDCPPRCLAEIKRTACPGEVIVVPFNIKNTCGNARKYKLGIRPLVNTKGEAAASQPWLDRTEIHLEPGQTATISFTINLMQGFHPGDCYQSDIVIREDKVNQNICFELCVTACQPVVEVHPLDEKRYLMRWQSWQDHYYCEQPTKPDYKTPRA